MPNTKWFNNSKLNYVENIFKNKNNGFPAIISLSESRIAKETSWSELEKEVAAIQAVFRNCGIEKGDRIAAFVTNIALNQVLPCWPLYPRELFGVLVRQILVLKVS
jgi:acetoacetyl-CoA synthetase